MVLYKYFPPERIDVLQTLKIRFSQPAIYNDPFELNPILTSEITEALFNNIMPILINHHGGSASEIAEIRGITYADFQNDQSRVLGLIQKVMASGSLALCLSEVSDSLLMWAHYGFLHSGFVIGFAEHEFLTCPKGTYYPKRIIYQENRPEVNLTNFDPSQTYFTKSLDWQYEKEWRIFKNGAGMTAVGVDNENWPIYLFDLPINSIEEIILGCRMRLDVQKVIRELVKDKFPHISIKDVKLSDNKYELIIS